MDEALKAGHVVDPLSEIHDCAAASRGGIAINTNDDTMASSFRRRRDMVL